MDLSKLVWALVAFGIGLTVGGCLEISALFIGLCLLLGAYFIASAVINGLAGLQQPQQTTEPEASRPIGYEQSLVDINEEQ